MRPLDTRGWPARTRIPLHSEENSAGCWIWTGYVMPNGYPKLGWLLAHRVSYEAFVGPIPEGMTVDHICFVPTCVNPEHLQLLTHSENCSRQRRALSPACQRGHPYTPENTKRSSSGTRTCRECLRITSRAGYHRRRAALDAVVIEGHEFAVPRTPVSPPVAPPTPIPAQASGRRAGIGEVSA